MDRERQQEVGSLELVHYTSFLSDFDWDGADRTAAMLEDLMEDLAPLVKQALHYGHPEAEFNIKVESDREHNDFRFKVTLHKEYIWT